MQTNSQDNEPNENHVAKAANSNSFFNLAIIALKNVQLKAPFANELSYDEIVNLNSTAFLEGFEVKEEGIYSISDDIVKRQSGVFSDMAKQMTKNIFKSGAISLSLPIRIFEPRSMLERYSDWFTYGPKLLKTAGQQTDKIEAFKYAITFIVSAMALSAGQLKPFNPLLGETWEGAFEDGTKVYMEHTSHTPCVSNYLMVDPEGLYSYYGFFDINTEGAVKMLFNNCLTMVIRGKHNIYLKGTGQTISFQLPKIILGGMIHGNRYVLFDSHMKFEDRENNIKATICFNKSHSNIKNKRIHDFYGEIFHHDHSKHSKKKDAFFEEKLPKHGFPSSDKNVYSTITGSWLENIVFDNKIYWSIPDSKPLQILPVQRPVSPSDSRYREDLQWLKRANLYPKYSNLYEEYAQAWKVALEIQQRHDRSMRKKK